MNKALKIRKINNEIELLKVIIKLIKKRWGKGCPDYAKGCPSCLAGDTMRFLKKNIEFLTEDKVEIMKSEYEKNKTKNTKINRCSSANKKRKSYKVSKNRNK